VYGAIVLALMSAFMVTRHTRAEEESGRAELVRATVVGRHAAPTAVLAVMVVTNLVVALGVTLGLQGIGLGAAGSFALGAGMAGAGMAFGALAAVTAQVTENTRAATGIAGAAIGAAFVVRAAGDMGNGALSWLSPLGWVHKVRPFDGEQWWVFGLFVATTAALVALAFALAARRDFAAGFVPPRPGPARAPGALLRPLGLPLRLQRASLVSWAGGLFLTGVAYGSVGEDVEEVVGDSDTVRDVIAQGQGDLTDLFFVTTALMLALIGAGYAVSSALRPRSEEAAGRAEPLLATALGRTRWMAGHLVLAVVGSAVVLAAAGAGTGLAYGIAVGDLGQLPRLTGVSLAYAPAVWVLVGLAVALFGAFPRAVPAIWGALAACAVVGILGQLLDLPGWVSDLSPFQHVPEVPASDLDVVPLAILTAVAAALLAGGLAAFRHRDLTT
jgi:ABC-2 type transport system permease protein